MFAEIGPSHAASVPSLVYYGWEQTSETCSKRTPCHQGVCSVLKHRFLPRAYCAFQHLFVLHTCLREHKFGNWIEFLRSRDSWGMQKCYCSSDRSWKEEPSILVPSTYHPELCWVFKLTKEGIGKCLRQNSSVKPKQIELQAGRAKKTRETFILDNSCCI